VAPDLVCEIRSASLTRGRARELAAASRERDGVEVVARRHRREWRLEIAEADELLAGETEHESTTWHLEASASARLADTLDWLLTELEDELTFQLEWAPPEADVEVVVTREELVRVVRGSRIGTRTRYRVLAGERR
jgi:hypothetical protein